eukprot:CAMPEP_0168625460 /NCGR_PEP_ID=MMETSP0449_2-20121227/10019_1 /TAXON_ID=1082188 /ORGANISM="Strombidium rassoulzadegani, Strain ras09" /LENGTH=83 /DNA_ID=CAMNT_0008667207 /DNA_START=83 /DNA_END=331 /DNA_ORIENTATION=-
MSAACVGYLVFDQLSQSEDETMQQVFRGLKLFWVLFVVLTVKRFLWDGPVRGATAAPGKKPAKGKAKPAKDGGDKEDDDEEEE